MGHVYVVTSILVAVMFLAAGTPGSATSENAAVGCAPDTIIENDSVRVWFQGLKGHIKVFDEARDDPNRPLYTYKTIQIAEVRGDEVVASVRLDTAMPHNSACSMIDTSTGVELMYFVQAPVDGVPGGVETWPGIRFLYRLDDAMESAKFDLFINNWPWAADDTELVFDFSVHSTLDMEAASNGVGFRDDDGNEAGYLDWDDLARVEYEDDREDESIVEGVVEMRPNEAFIRLRYTDVEAGFEDLEYDPWVGATGYDIVAGRLIGDDAAKRALPPVLRPVYDQVDDLLR